MSTRTFASSGWYLPLMAGTETARKTGTLSTPLVPAGLPPPPAVALPGLMVWYDAAALSTLQVMPDGGVFRWDDRSGNNAHAAQTVAALRPTLLSTTLLPRAVNLD